MERSAKICKKCNRKISLSNFTRHDNSCLGEIKKLSTTACMCGKVFKNRMALGAHRGHCGKNRKYPVVSWNKGLTAETDSRVKQGGKTYAKRIKNGEIIPYQFGKKSTQATKDKIAKTVNNKIKNGTWHNSFSRSRTHEYKGINLHGKWELEYAKYLDSKKIKWRRPNEKFPYIFEGKSRYYTPDFYLIEDNQYIEIKGYETDKDRAKWQAFPLNLRIIKGKELYSLNLIQHYKK